MKRRSLTEIKADAKLLARCQSIDDVCEAIYASKSDVMLNILNPKYNCFQVRKPNGGYRQVESPAEGLKTIQRQFNYLLQALYYENQTKASYGFIINPKNKKNKKNIVKNAASHLGKPYMLNVDFEDFFHQIKLNDVVTIFSGNLLDFKQKDAFALARLCIYNNHLPMGAPTSPVLSNLYTIPLDNDLQHWADNNQVTFTRFVDDLTFSSFRSSFTEKQLEEITLICAHHHLRLNAKKTKFKGPDDEKIVTGLQLNKTVDIPEDFYTQLNEDLKRLKSINEVSLLTRQMENNIVLNKFKQEVQGQLNFIGMVEGYSSPEFREYRRLFNEALEVDEEIFSMRWTSFSYL